MKGDVSLGKKIREFDFKPDLDFHQDFFRSYCLYFALIQEIPQQVHQQLRPKPKSSGLRIEANLDSHDKNFFFQCFNISKQGTFLQVNYRGIV